MQILSASLLGMNALCSIYIITLYIKGNKRGWWRSYFAQLLLLMTLSIGTLFTWSTLVTLWPNIPGKVEARIILFALLTGTMLRNSQLMTRVYRAIRGERGNGRS